MRDYKLLGGSLWGLERVKRARECENVLGKMKVILAFYVIIANKCSHINLINLLRNIITIFLSLLEVLKLFPYIRDKIKLPR